jgi:hypothetical protein
MIEDAKARTGLRGWKEVKLRNLGAFLDHCNIDNKEIHLHGEIWVPVSTLQDSSLSAVALHEYFLFSAVEPEDGILQSNHRC